MTYEQLFEILKNSKDIDDLKRYQSDFVELVPGYEVMIGYDQNNHYHQYDLEEHSLYTVLNLEKGIDDDMLYFAALIHDIGKPEARCSSGREGDTESHFYGHPEKSYVYTRNHIIPFMKENGYTFKEKEEDRLLYYVLNHDFNMSLRLKSLRKQITQTDFETFRKLMYLQIADAKAHVQLPLIQNKIEICNTWLSDYGREKYEELCSEN